MKPPGHGGCRVFLCVLCDLGGESQTRVRRSVGISHAAASVPEPYNRRGPSLLEAFALTLRTRRSSFYFPCGHKGLSVTSDIYFCDLSSACGGCFSSSKNLHNKGHKGRTKDHKG